MYFSLIFSRDSLHSNRILQSDSIVERSVFMKYCKYCDREVKPRKEVNWIIVLLLIVLTGGVGLLIYLPFYVFKHTSCPICGAEL